MTRATDFFMSTVAPTAEEFLGDVADIRRARLAAIVLNQMVDYWFLENQTRFKNKSDVYTELERRCPKFPILRDVADASNQLSAGPTGATNPNRQEHPKLLRQAEPCRQPAELLQ